VIPDEVRALPLYPRLDEIAGTPATRNLLMFTAINKERRKEASDDIYFSMLGDFIKERYAHRRLPLDRQ
jgi:hypothetical protein